MLDKPSMSLEVVGFGYGDAIPARFTADGLNVSPALRWSGVPQDARELALIVEDPDAPRHLPFAHWVAFHIPPSAGGVPEATAPTTRPARPAGTIQGRNDFGAYGYSGPAPRIGDHTHHYHFKLFALDEAIDVRPGCNSNELKSAMSGHVIAEADFVGVYTR